MSVLSIPAGNTGRLVHTYFIYVCPSTYSEKVGDNKFFCFRHQIGKIKGATDRIYEFDKVIEMDTSDSVRSANINNTNLSLREKQSIREYFLQFGTITKEPVYQGNQLVIFLKKPAIKLFPKLPRPERNNVFWTNYTFEELENNIVLPKRNER